jgi:hypothetical protein
VRERPPRRAVGEHGDLAGQDRAPDQVVQHDVGTQPRREPERRGVAQRERHEVGVGQLGEVVLDAHLGDRVRRDRFERRVLADELVARLRAVDRARRGVREALDACLLRQPGEPRRRVVVDVVGDLGGERAERVVRQRRHVHDRVEALQVRDGDVAQVDRKARHVGGVERAEHAVGEQAAVEAGDLVAGRGEDRGHDGAQVALVAGQQNAHVRSLRINRRRGRCR